MFFLWQKISKEDIRMNQKKLLAAFLFSILLILVGCQNGAKDTTTENSTPASQGNETKQEEVQEITATIEIFDLEDKKVESKTVELKDKQSLMEVLKENFEVDETNGFINGVGELRANSDEKQYIAIKVNGELAAVGANDLIIEDGDVVSLSLEVWE
jgi:hypothetical protein